MFLTSLQKEGECQETEAVADELEHLTALLDNESLHNGQETGENSAPAAVFCTATSRDNLLSFLAVVQNNAVHYAFSASPKPQRCT